MGDYREDFLKKLRDKVERWERETLPKSLSRFPERMERFTTLSGIEVRRLYTPLDIKDTDYLEKIGLPGE